MRTFLVYPVRSAQKNRTAHTVGFTDRAHTFGQISSSRLRARKLAAISRLRYGYYRLLSALVSYFEGFQEVS